VDIRAPIALENSRVKIAIVFGLLVDANVIFSRGTKRVGITSGTVLFSKTVFPKRHAVEYYQQSNTSSNPAVLTYTYQYVFIHKLTIVKQTKIIIFL